jgi:flagellar protein FlaI
MPVPKRAVFSYQIKKEGSENIIDINFLGSPIPPSIEDSAPCMMKVMQFLSQVEGITRIVLSERRFFEYDSRQAKLLNGIVHVIKQLRQGDEFQMPNVQNPAYFRVGQEAMKFVQTLSTDLLFKDPIGAYVELKRVIRHEELEAKREIYPEYQNARLFFLKNFYYKIRDLLESTRLIQLAQPFLEGYVVGDRSVYRRIFKPTVRPNFTFTRLMAEYPAGEIIDSYKVEKTTEVNVFRIPGEVRQFYHLMPPEFKLSEEQFDFLDRSRQMMAQHAPKTGELIEPERIRESFFDISRDMIRDLAVQKGYKLSNSENRMLAEILTRETAGFGILELILADPKVQDITINAPPGQSPIFIYHGTAEDCSSNVIPTKEEVDSWASRLKLISGRPLDQANPVLDTSIHVPGARARVAAITNSLSPFGLAFALRRHRDNPWTYPLFIKNRYLSPLAAGLLSFLVDGARTMLIAGTRSAGKTSFLGATMLEIMRRYRVITVEDTLELPTNSLMRMGFNIQPLKVQSAIVQLESELTAADGIRTSLRLGDSALIVGEVRSGEAVALYEAMRVGALASVVAGTIHGDSPYGVYDRIVNDLHVPKTSFKATDIIAVANPIKSADGLHKLRRCVQISEIRKHWEDDPMKEQGFVDLMLYNAKKDMLEPTPVLMDGESEILSSIASRVKDWVGNFDAVWENIQMRSDMKQALVDYSEKSKNQRVIEAEFSVKSNDMMHIITEQVQTEVGAADTQLIYERWNRWVRDQIRQKKV